MREREDEREHAEVEPINDRPNPYETIRNFGVRVKLNPVRELIEGRRVVLVDDSIVRGTTSRQIVEMAREAGARKVYFGDWVETPSYWFDDLSPGMQLAGPALIDSESTTVVLPPGSRADVDAYGSLIVTNSGDPA